MFGGLISVIDFLSDCISFWREFLVPLYNNIHLEGKTIFFDLRTHQCLPFPFVIYSLKLSQQ